MVSRICEEFSCLPSEAMHEPLELAMDIMELRAYAKMKDVVDRAEKQTDLPDHPMIDMVSEIYGDIAQEIRAKRRERHG